MYAMLFHYNANLHGLPSPGHRFDNDTPIEETVRLDTTANEI